MVLVCKRLFINIQKPRDGKTVYVGQTFRDVTYTLEDDTEMIVVIRTIYEFTECSIDRHGQYFSVPDIELNRFWTNLPLSNQEIIDLCHAHGESEQYHSEILELTVIAYNILRIICQESLMKRDAIVRRKMRWRRIRTVISNLM